MKHFYVLLTLLCFHIVTAQQKKDDLGIPVGGIEKVSVIRDPDKDTNKASSALNDDTASLEFDFPIAEDVDFNGGTKGQFSVSLTGAATYNLPIEVPPGINGIEPKIGIAYSSQSGNGIAGYGWNISGLSSINKIGSNKFYDGKNSTITYSSTDRFSLDGQRLLLKSGVYGMDGAEYQTENYNNLKITSHGSPQSNYGPEYFKVQYPDGNVAIYGKTYNGIISGLRGEKTRSNTIYALTYVVNPQNVILKYNYINDNGNLLISKISYGYTTTNPLNNRMVIGTYNSVSFTYKDRNRNENAYIFNDGTKLTKILDKITVYGFSETFRTYQLTYKISSLGYEQLQKITEISGDGTLTKTPVIFTYGPDNLSQNPIIESAGGKIQTSDLSGLSNIGWSNTKLFTGDFSGDSNLGFLMHATSVQDGYKQYTIGDKLYIFNPSEDKFIIQKFPIGKHFSEVVTSKVLNHNNMLLPNLGWTIITQKNKLANAIEYEFNSFIYMPQSSGDIYPIGTSSTVIMNEKPDVRRQFLSGDLNGDGITDIVRTEHNTNFDEASDNQYNTAIEVYNLRNKMLYVTPNIPIGYNYQLIDTNGDGYDELIIFRHEEIRIYRFDLNTNKFVIDSIINAPGTVTFGKPVYVGDFNGDGKLDFVTPRGDYYSQWHFYINQGDGNYKYFLADIGVKFEKNESGYSDATYDREIMFNFIITDFNNDGKSDIIKFKEDCKIKRTTNETLPVQSSFWAYENLNFDIDPQNIKFTLNAPQQDFGQFNQRHPLIANSNFNQKNYKTELVVLTDNKLKFLKASKDNILTHQLKIINEFDITTKITYDVYDEKKVDLNIYGEDGILPFASLQETMSVYPKADVDVAPGMYLVTKATYNTYKGLIIGESSSERKQLFSYADATIDYNGKGFLGFKGHMATNIYQVNTQGDALKNQIKTATYFDLNNNGLVNEETVAHGRLWFNFFTPPISYISKKLNTYNTTNLSNKVFKSEILQTSVNEGLSGIQRIISNSYDAYSNPLSVTETVTGGGDISTLKTVFTYANSLIDNNYYVGRITSKISTVNNEQISKENYSYTGNLLTNITKEAALGSASLSETNEYDGFGNITKKTLAATDIQPRISSYSYDTTGRYLEKETDVEGLVKNYSHNKEKGWLMSQTSPYGLTSSAAYNAFGIPVSTTDYLGKTTTFVYKTNAVSLGNTFIRKETTFPDGRKERITTNGWGKKTSEGHTDIDGNWINSSYNYDSQDRLVKISEPYKNIASLFTTFEYDNYGRIVKTVLPTGRELTIDYNGLTTTTDDGVKTRIETKNINKNIKKVVDNGETLNYTYNNNGTLKNTNYAGNIISFEYDSWGRKTKITDPSAGTYTYEYNSIGDLLKETTPKGIITNVYDATGKISQTTQPGNIINYVYRADKLLDRITTSSPMGAYQEIFTYDNYKRINSKKYTTPLGFNYTYTYSFDDLGRNLTEEKQVTGPSGTDAFKTKNVYKNGYLWKLQNGYIDSDLKIYNAFNERGQVTSFTLGNGLPTINTYDQYGYLTQTAVVQRFALTNTWDVQRGTLSSRTNSLFTGGINETFQYDSFDRLISNSTLQGNSIITYEANNYDNKGRIVSSAVGDYKYDASKPYQLLKVENLNDLPYYQNNSLQLVEYDVNKLPRSIKQQGKENIYFNYDGFKNRTAMYYGNEASVYTASTKVRYYSPDGDIEVDYDKTANKYVVNIYVDGDPYTASTLIRKENNVNAMYYLHRDYLGSLLAISNNLGSIVEKRHFDAWGNVLLVQDGQNNNLSKLTFMERGYTGHEHLQDVGLINMNARLYDSKLHRFLAPDNFVQDTGNPQNHNLYAYGLNNPLKFTDPTGHVWHIVIGAVVGGVINLSVKAVQGKIHSFKDGAVAFGIGAVAGAVAAASGGTAFVAAGGAAAGGGGFIAGAIGGMAGSFFSAPFQSIGNNLYFGDPMMTEADLAMNIAIGGVTGGVLNGSLAALNSKSFWTGDVIPKAPASLSLSPSISNVPDTNASTQVANTNTSLETQALTPFQKGQLGVQRAIEEEVLAKGGKVLTQEVTLEVNGVRVRVDVAADFNGEIILMEVKNGPSAGFTPNQKIVYPQMQEGVPVIPRGVKALPIWGAEQIGKPTTQYYLKIIEYGKTQ